MSQRELARRAGVSRTTLVDIEHGRRDPGIETLRTIVQAAGFDLDLQLLPADPHDRALLATLRALGPEREAQLRASVDRFVRGLASGLDESRPLVGSGERRSR